VDVSDHSSNVKAVAKSSLSLAASDSARWSVKAISAARDSLDGKSNDHQGIGGPRHSNLVPTDGNSIAYSRTAARVLNIVHLSPKMVRKGGFFPAGVNGSINMSGH
jgi:hypothetical protein